MAVSLAASESFAFGAGLVQALLAIVFWRGRQVRPDWGPGWLALAYGCAALLNMPGMLMPVGELFVPSLHALAVAVLGNTSLAALVVGMRAYFGIVDPRPWRRFGLVVAVIVGPGLVLGLGGLGAMGGQLAACLPMLYLAALAVAALRRKPAAGGSSIAAALLAYPVMLGLTLAFELNADTLNQWAAVPYALVGLSLLAVGIGRYHLELQAELARRQEAEAELRQLNATLERRIDTRTAELRQMVAGLESFNRMVSHDLRGPLGGLSGLAVVARRALQRGDSARAERTLDAMQAETLRLGHLVADLMLLARIDHEALDLEPTPLDQVLDAALASLQASQGSTGSASIVREPLPAAQVDRHLLHQVFVNLLANAQKFSAGRERASVCVRGERSGDRVVVEVRDHGVGFPPERAAELFQPFGRLHGTDFPGTGVGLSIVRRIVERHGGQVWAEGRPGEGASFYFSVPG